MCRHPRRDLIEDHQEWVDHMYNTPYWINRIPLAFTLPFSVPLRGLSVSGNASFWTYTAGLLALSGAYRLLWRPRLS